MSAIAPATTSFQNLKDANMFQVSAGFSKQQRFCFDSRMSWNPRFWLHNPNKRTIDRLDAFNRCVGERWVFCDGLMT